jgi:hypothetical protein
VVFGWIDQGFCGGADGGASDASGGNVETSRAVAQQAAPAGELTEAAFPNAAATRQSAYRRRNQP